MKKSIVAAAALLAAGQLLALPAEFLAPDTTGHPQIKITGSGDYYVFRAADAYDVACDTRWYATEVDTNGKDWCRTLVTYPNNGVLTDKLPLDAIAENSPAEFEYKVGTSTSVDSATYIGWAPQIAVAATDPVDAWVQTINTNYGTSITRSNIPDTGSAAGAMSALTVSYSSTSHNWTVYYNNKYVALFNENGALVGLTHRTYGMEFIKPYTLTPEKFYPYIINTPADTLGSSTAFTKTISNGQLIMNWSSLWSTGFSITIAWDLKSNSDAVSSSGLNGKITVNTSGTEIKSLRFPFVYGLSYGSGKVITVPQYNSGRNYFPATSYSSATTLTTYGEYPSSNWQAQFYSIRDGQYALYMGAEDAQQSAKNFHTYSVVLNEGTPVAGFADIMLFPQNGSANVSTTYPMVMSPMVGSWEKAAKKYQYWATKQLWNYGDATTLPTNTERPVSQRLKNGVFWWTPFSSYRDTNGNLTVIRPTQFVNNWANVQKNLIGQTSSGGQVNAGFHLYNWWDNTFDTNYPEFTPNADSGSPTMTWQQAVTTVQSDGSLVAPYITGADTDVTNASLTDLPTYNNIDSRDSSHCPQETTYGWWNKQYPTGSGVYLKDSMLTGSNSIPYVACFVARLHALMDPAASYWQAVVDNNVDTVFGLKATGVYLDSFAASNSQRDSYLSPAISGHTTGFGDWYRNGLRQIGRNTVSNAAAKELLDPVYSEENVRRFVASEHFAEAVLPYVDIVMNYQDAGSNSLPVVQSIYNQFQMTAGQRALPTQSDAVKKAVFGRSFAWGFQLGLESINYICPGSVCTGTSTQDVFSYLRKLVKAREDAQQSGVGLDWNSARLVGLADDTANTVNYSGSDDWCYTTTTAACPAPLPTVRGSLWSSAGNNAANYLVLTNPTGSSVSSSISVPRAWTNLTLVYQSGSGATSSATPFGSIAALTVPANSVSIYKNEADSDGDGVDDSIDSCPAMPNSEQGDIDGDGIGDYCDDTPGC